MLCSVCTACPPLRIVLPFTPLLLPLPLHCSPHSFPTRRSSDLTDGRYDELELTDDYTVTILEAGVPKPVISGGEEDVATLVLRLAISQMIAERAGQPLSPLVLDEIFGSLGGARRLYGRRLRRGVAL